MVAAIHLLLAVVATYPLIVAYNSAVIGGGDTVQNAWNFWWVDWAVGHGDLFPYYTTLIYHPTGVSLAYHTLGLVNGWLGALLQSGLGLSLVSTYNTVTLLTFVGSGLTSYLLVRWLTGSGPAALVASLIFTFAPVRMSRVFFGNLNLYSTQFIPLALLFVLKLIQTRRRRYAFWAALVIAATAGLDLFLAYGTGLFALLLLVLDLGQAVRQRTNALIKTAAGGMLWFGVATLFLALPFVLPLVRNFADFRDQSDQWQASTANSADLLGFFVPDSPTMPLIKRISPMFAQGIDRIFLSFSGNLAEKSVFIGYAVLILVTVSMAVSRRQQGWRWLGAAGLFAVLSLGPALHVGGRVLITHLPYAWLSAIPLLSFGRSPNRFAIFTMLALAVVVGYGLATLEGSHRRFRWMILVAGFVVFAEFLIAPIRLDTRFERIPRFYAQLGETAAQARNAVLDVPIDLFGAQGPAAEYMLYQTVHQRPIVSGYISRTPQSVRWIFNRPFLFELRARTYGNTAPFGVDAALLSQAMADLRLLAVETVVVHRWALLPQDYEVLRSLFSSLLAEPVYEDGQITVWQVDVSNHAAVPLRAH